MAVAERTCRQDALLVERLLTVERPSNQRGALESIVLERLEDYVSSKEARLRIELWAEAQFRPALRTVLRRGLEEASEKAEGALRAANGRHDTATISAREMIGLFQGAILYRALGMPQSNP